MTACAGPGTGTGKVPGDGAAAGAPTVQQLAISLGFNMAIESAVAQPAVGL